MSQLGLGMVLYLLWLTVRKDFRKKLAVSNRSYYSLNIGALTHYGNTLLQPCYKSILCFLVVSICQIAYRFVHDRRTTKRP